MDIHSDNPEHGFQFPGTFELSAMGSADKDLKPPCRPPCSMPASRSCAKPVNWKHSSGRYVSVRIAFRANSREELRPRARSPARHPEVKWTL